MTTNQPRTESFHAVAAQNQSGYEIADRQIEATLALAYEQRTANMLALYRMGGLWRSAVLREELGYAIKERLGASEATDE